MFASPESSALRLGQERFVGKGDAKREGGNLKGHPVPSARFLQKVVEQPGN